MRIRAVISVVVALTGITASAGCMGPKRKPAATPLVPTMQPRAAPPAPDAHLDEVRKNAAVQLQCPLEQVNVVCTRRDLEGECISVRADGCDGTFEYQFGDA